MVMIPLKESEVTELYAAIGHSLATWAAVETDLTIIFYGLAGNKTRQQAAAIMDSIVSLNTRLEVVDALFKLLDQTPMDAALWNRVIERCRTLYKRRHKLAHFRILAVEKKGGGAAPQIAPFFSHERWITQQQKTITLNEVLQITATWRGSMMRYCG